MEKYVPLEKRSKKEQKEFHSMKRNTWNGLNPMTRVTPNGKAYSRSKQKTRNRKEESNE